MQLWHGREGECLVLGQTGLASNIVVCHGQNGLVEVLIFEPSEGETLADALSEAQRRAVRFRKRLTDKNGGG